VYETLRKVQEQPPVPLRELEPGFDRDLETIILTCMRKEPSERYADARALADDLDRWLAGEPIAARGESIAYRLKRVLAKRRFALAGAGVAAAVVALAVFVPRWREAVRRLEAQAAVRPHLDRGREHVAAVERLLSLPGRDEAALAEAGRRAAEEFDRALAADPSCGEALVALARLRRLEGDDPRALEACERAVAADPAFAGARLERARLLLDRYEAMRHGRKRSPQETPESRELWRRIEEDLAYVDRWSGRTEERELALAPANGSRRPQTA